MGWNGNDTIFLSSFLSFFPVYDARGYSKMEDARREIGRSYTGSRYIPAWGRYYDSLVGLQVSYLGADNFGDVFSVANKAANRLDSGRVQPGILFLVVPSSFEGPTIYSLGDVAEDVIGSSRTR